MFIQNKKLVLPFIFLCVAVFGMVYAEKAHAQYACGPSPAYCAGTVVSEVQYDCVETAPKTCSWTYRNIVSTCDGDCRVPYPWYPGHSGCWWGETSQSCEIGGSIQLPINDNCCASGGVTCGNGVCDGDENCSNCAADCGACPGGDPFCGCIGSCNRADHYAGEGSCTRDLTCGGGCGPLGDQGQWWCAYPDGTFCAGGCSAQDDADGAPIGNAIAESELSGHTTCRIVDFAADPNRPDTPIVVRFEERFDNGDPNVFLGSAYADQVSHPYVPWVLGTCDAGNGECNTMCNNEHPNCMHNFVFNIPEYLKDGAVHSIWAVGENISSTCGFDKLLDEVDIRCSPGNSAQCVSHTIPSSIPAGATRTVTVSMYNYGGTQWYGQGAPNTYKLGSADPLDNLTWGLSRVYLGADTVDPDTLYTFTFDITAPATPGTYSSRWQMVQDGVGWFGDLCGPTTVEVTSGPPNGTIQFQGAPTTERVRDVSVNGTETVTALVNKGGGGAGLNQITALACNFTDTGCDTSFDWILIGQQSCGGADQCSITADTNPADFFAPNKTWYIAINGYDLNWSWCTGNPTPHPYSRCDTAPPIEDFLTLNTVSYQISGDTLVVEDASVCTGTPLTGAVSQTPTIQYTPTTPPGPAYSGAWNGLIGAYTIADLPLTSAGNFTSTDPDHISDIGISFEFACVNNPGGFGVIQKIAGVPPAFGVSSDLTVDVGYIRTNETEEGWIQAYAGDIYGESIISDVPATAGFGGPGKILPFLGAKLDGKLSSVFSSQIDIDDAARISEVERYIDGGGTATIDHFWANDINFEPPQAAQSATHGQIIAGKLETEMVYEVPRATMQSVLNTKDNYKLSGANGVAIIYVTGGGTLTFPDDFTSNDPDKRLLLIVDGSIEFDDSVGSRNPNVNDPAYVQVGIIASGSITFPTTGDPATDSTIVVEGPLVSLQDVVIERNMDALNNILPGVAVVYNPIYITNTDPTGRAGVRIVDIQWKFE